MMWHRVVLSISALALLPLPGLAQQPPDIPTREEIEQMIQQEYDRLPETTCDFEGVHLTYKVIPTDPAEILRGRQLPMGLTPEQVMAQYGHMAQPFIDEWFGKIGRFETDRPLHYNRTDIPAGSYTFGLVMQSNRPVGWAIQDLREPPERVLREPLAEEFRRRQANPAFETIEMRFEAHDGGGFDLLVGFNDVVCKTRRAFTYGQ